MSKGCKLYEVILSNIFCKHQKEKTSNMKFRRPSSLIGSVLSSSHENNQEQTDTTHQQQQQQSNTNNNTDVKIKLIVVGEFAVGKTSLLSRYVYHEFDPIYRSSIGVDLVIRNVDITVNNLQYNVVCSFWDTAGDERFRSLTMTYFRDCSIVLLVYDKTSKRSFRSLKTWLSDIEKQAPSDVLVVLVGNKLDMTDDIAVTETDGKNFAEENQIPFFYEVSAKSSENVDLMFEQVLQQTVERLVSQSKVEDKPETIRVTDNKEQSQKQSRNCCK
jgi:small GTP-binding protein